MTASGVSSDEDDGVQLSSGVVVAALRPGNPAGDSDGDDQARPGGRGRDAPAQNNQIQDDELESMDWWDHLTPGQQRAMMKRFLIQPPAAAPVAAPAPVIVNAPATPAARTKMKTLHLEDFRGTADESVEAWLATIHQEVERQAGLGGDTWTAEELYYGVTAHLQDRASTWLTTLTTNMRREDKTLDFLVRKLRKKYGRRDNVFKVQQRLASRVQKPGERLSDYAGVLTDIGFSHQVPAEVYVEAFVNGINNQTAAMQVKGHDPKTLEDAVQYAEDTCGEYGEGFRVTVWRGR
ncbi:putative Polyprotein [Phytophthora palmivora]|uniref:Polyprotein n=1 Tax=Phytophthora palmivora TaxID=4796 RepID=A0A2P4XEW0_9STRA|nr:putative Polyprotein [Phytophthora palmivora]